MKSLPSIFSATRRAHRALNRCLRASADLNAVDYEVLCFIGENPGILRARISERLGVDLTSVGRIVRGFAKNGWIAGDGDLRYVPIRLTQEGVEAHADLSLKGLVIEQKALRLTNGSAETLLRDLQAISRLGNV